MTTEPPKEVVESPDGLAGGGEDDGGGDGGDRGSPARWVTVATFPTPELAHLARARLEGEGILVFVADAHIAGTAWHYALATGGAKVQVPEPDAARATALLRAGSAAAADAYATAEEDDGDMPVSTTAARDVDCPKCGSPYTRPVRFTGRRVAGIVLLTFVAVSIHPLGGLALLVACVWLVVRSADRTCATCGHDWSVRRDAARRGFPVTPMVPGRQAEPSDAGGHADA